MSNMSSSSPHEKANPPQQPEPALQDLDQQNADANSAEFGPSGNESRPVFIPAGKDNGNPQDTAHSQSLPDEKQADEVPANHVSKRPSYWQRLLLDTWFPEAIATSFSVGCIAAIVGVLLAYDTEISPQFPYGLTLNAIISILAIGSKSSLLFVMAEVLSQLKWCWFTRSRKLEDIQTFDNASRGPWGSITMISRLYEAPLGSATALVITLALAFEPFLQQAIRYPIRHNEHNSNLATVQKSSLSVQSWIRPFTIATHAGTWANSSDSFDPQTKCPSGNCRWPSFRSYGWCSACGDITSLVQDEVNKCDIRGYLDRFLHNSSGFYECYANAHHRAGIPVLVGQNGSFTTKTPLLTAYEYTSGYVEGTLNGIKHPLIAIAYVSYNPTSFVYGSKDIRVTRAEECAITPCARDYQVHVQNGIPKVHVTGMNYGLIGYQWIYGSKFDNLCWKPEPGNVTFAPVPPENTSQDISFSQVYRNESSHAFCSVDVYQGIIQQAFDTSVTCVNKREYKSAHGISENCQDSDEYALLSLVKDHGLSRVMNNVAASLTKLALDQSGETVTGNATTAEVYVQVEWEWLILPLALEMAAIALFLATVFVNRRKTVRLWKASLLPIVYHEFAQEKLNMEEAIAEVSGMEIMAREAIARLDARKKPAL